MVGDVMATLYITLFIRYISTNCSILIWIGLSLNVLALILGFFIVESPEWLLSAGDKQGAIAALHKIAKMNGVTDFEIHDLKVVKFETIDPEKKAAVQGSEVGPTPEFGNSTDQPGCETEIEADVCEGKKLI